MRKFGKVVASSMAAPALSAGMFLIFVLGG